MLFYFKQNIRIERELLENNFNKEWKNTTLL